LTAANRTLRKANEALSKCRRAKKTRIRQGVALTIEDAHNILAQKEVDEQIRRHKRSGEAFRTTGIRLYDAVVLAEKLVIMHGPIRKLKKYLVLRILSIWS
jgi:hypothetical protein